MQLKAYLLNKVNFLNESKDIILSINTFTFRAFVCVYIYLLCF